MSFDLEAAISKHNAAAKNLNNFGGSAAVATRNNAEQQYALACRELMRHGYMYKLKRKYTGR